MNAILIKNATIVTMDDHRRTIRDGALTIRGQYIEAVGKLDSMGPRPRADKVIDARGKLVLPGFINTHTHYFQNLLKGLGDDRVLVDWFRTVTGPSAAKLSQEDCYIAALSGCLEAIKSGTTFTLDFMYAHPTSRLSDAVIRAFKDIGIRGIFARGIVDTGSEWGVPEELIQNTKTALNDCERIFRRYDGDDQDRIRVWIAPCMIWTISKEGLAKSRELADKLRTRIAIHVSETPFEVKVSEQLYGSSELEVMDRLGVTGPDLLAVHCIWVTPRDIRIMKERGVKVSHCPVSNMYLSSGVAPIPRMIESGITVGMGVDGAASNNNQDMIQCMKFAALLHKVHNAYDPTVFTCEKALEMATIDGARAVGLEKEIGSLEPGKKADVIVVDLFRPNTVPSHHPISSLVYSANGDNVESVIVNGKLVMENRVVNTVDEVNVLERAAKAADSLAKRAGTSYLKKRPWRSIAF